MIKLGDLISDSYSNIVIMDGTSEFISINPYRVEKLKIITDMFELEVEKIESKNDTIRVWLKED